MADTDFGTQICYSYYGSSGQYYRNLFASCTLQDDRTYQILPRSNGERFVRFDRVKGSSLLTLELSPSVYSSMAALEEFFSRQLSADYWVIGNMSMAFRGVIQNRTEYVKRYLSGRYATRWGANVNLEGRMLRSANPETWYYSDDVLQSLSAVGDSLGASSAQTTYGETILTMENMETGTTYEFDDREIPNPAEYKHWLQEILESNQIRTVWHRHTRGNEYYDLTLPIALAHKGTTSKLYHIVDDEAVFKLTFYDGDEYYAVCLPNIRKKYINGLLVGGYGTIVIEQLIGVVPIDSSGAVMTWEVDTGEEWDAEDEVHVYMEDVEVVDGAGGITDPDGYLNVGATLATEKTPEYELDVDWLNTQLGTSLSSTQGITMARWQDASGNWHLYGVVKRGTQHYCIAEYDETAEEWDSVLHSFNSPREWPNVMTAQIDGTILCFINHVYLPISDVVYTTDGTTFSTVQTTGAQDYKFVGGICEHGGDFFIAGHKYHYNGVTADYESTPMIYKFTTSTKAISVVYTGTLTTGVYPRCYSICSDGTNMYVGVTDFNSTANTEILRSEDDGGTWSQVYTPTSADGNVVAACAYSSQLGRVAFCSDDYAVYTDDGGDKWTEQALSGISLSYQNDVQQMAAYVDSNGDNRWAVTYRGATGPDTISVSFDDDFSDAATDLKYGGIYSIETWPIGASSRVIPGIGLLLQGDTEYVAGGGYGPNAYWWMLKYDITGNGYWRACHNWQQSAEGRVVRIWHNITVGSLTVMYRSHDNYNLMTTLPYRLISISDQGSYYQGSIAGVDGQYCELLLDPEGCIAGKKIEKFQVEVRAR